MNIQEKISYINALAIEISHTGVAFVKTAYNGIRNEFIVYVESPAPVSTYGETALLGKPGAIDQLNGMIHTLLRIRRAGGISE